MKLTLPRIFLAVLAAGFALAANVRADEEKLSAADRAFVKEVNQINMVEVQMGKLAQKQSSNNAIRKFGDRLVEDHTIASDELTALAQKKGITLAKELDSKEKQMVDRFTRLSGGEFDRMFSKEMVAGHEKAIEKFEMEIKNGHDADVKAWASKRIATLREHLEMARSTLTVSR